MYISPIALQLCEKTMERETSSGWSWWCPAFGSPKLMANITHIHIYVCITLWLWLTSPWYRWQMAHRNRWFTELKNGGSFHGHVIFYQMVYWYLGLWKHVLHSFFLVHHHRLQVIPPYFLQKRSRNRMKPTGFWRAGSVFDRTPLQSMKSSLNHHEIPLKPSWNHHETIILMGQTMTKPCLFSMLRTLPGSFGRTQLQVLGTEPGGVEKRTGPTGADVATPPGTIWLLTLW